MQVLQRLVATGNTVLVIEHNLDVVKTADWPIDLGPEGGDQGGRIVAEGPPEAIAANAESHRPVPRGGPGGPAGWRRRLRVRRTERLWMLA